MPYACIFVEICISAISKDLKFVLLTSMKIDIPFLSSIWALGSSDTHWTSSEQSIIHNEASPVNCTGMRALQPLIWSKPLVKRSDFASLSSQPEFTNHFLIWISQLNLLLWSASSCIFVYPHFPPRVIRLIALRDNSAAIICTGSAHTTNVSENARFYFESKITELPVMSWPFQSGRQLLLWWFHKSAAHLCWSIQSVIQMQMCFILFDTLISWYTSTDRSLEMCQNRKQNYDHVYRIT